eukprot:5908646-Amphidinium_carterae.1
MWTCPPPDPGREPSWLNKMVADQREGCFGRYLPMPRQLAGKAVGMNKERAVYKDVHFRQVTF